MNICIIGAGVVGSFLAEKLAKEDFSVTVVDRDPVKLENLAYKKNILTLNCDISQEDCFNRCEENDFYLVLTDNDELNIATALLIRETRGKENIFVRIFKPIYNNLCESLQLNYVNVVESTVLNLNLLLEYPFAKGVWQIGDTVIWSIKVGKYFPLIGESLKELAPIRKKLNFSIVLIRRGKNFIVPRGQTIILEKDEVYIAVDKEHAEELLKFLNLNKGKVKNLFILGYSQYLDFWLKTLEDKDYRIKFFHPDGKICETLGQKYPFVEAYQTYLTDRETLLSEGIDGADYVWCLDEVDERNIVTAMFVKNLSAKRVGILLKHPQYEDFIPDSDIDAYVLPKKVTASKIYSLLKGKEMLEVIELAEGIDIFEIPYDGELLPLKKLRLDPNELVLFIRKNGRNIIPKGDTLVEKGDILLILRKI